MTTARPFADVNTKTLADGVRYYRNLASPTSSFAKEAAATQQARLDELALRAARPSAVTFAPTAPASEPALCLECKGSGGWEGGRAHPEGVTGPACEACDGSGLSVCLVIP